MAEKETDGVKVVCENRKARYNYQILDTFEAGIVLSGAEIKSIRAGNISIGESWVKPEGTELFALQIHINPYAFNHDKSYDPERKRKLLMHKREIERLRGAVEKRGLTIIPLKIYLKRGYAKMLVGLAKGKAAPDKRETVKEREGRREAERAMKRG